MRLLAVTPSGYISETTCDPLALLAVFLRLFLASGWWIGLAA
jgi:hypothetical protein